LTVEGGRRRHPGQRRQDAGYRKFLPQQEMSRSMPLYVSLTNFTYQGIKTSATPYAEPRTTGPDRAARRPAPPAAVDPWRLRPVAVVEFPDDEAATAVLLQLGALGNIRTTTMKALDAEQMRAIIGRTG
jgi:uncharacterized protein with GYD domain